MGVVEYAVLADRTRVIFRIPYYGLALNGKDNVSDEGTTSYYYLVEVLGALFLKRKTRPGHDKGDGMYRCHDKVSLIADDVRSS